MIWYIDSELGDDKNPGTEEFPRRTYSSILSKRLIGPGDQILLRRGRAYRETLTLSNTPQYPGSEKIRVSSYGTGKLPAIDCFQPVAKWALAFPTFWLCQIEKNTKCLFREIDAGVMRVQRVENISEDMPNDSWGTLHDPVSGNWFLVLRSENDPNLANYKVPGLHRGIHLSNAHAIDISEISVVGASGDGGITIEHGSDNIELREVRVVYCANNGIMCTGREVVMTEVFCDYNGATALDHGIYLGSFGDESSGNVQLIQCSAWNNSGAGLHIFRTWGDIDVKEGNFRFNDTKDVIVSDIRSSQVILRNAMAESCRVEYIPVDAGVRIKIPHKEDLYTTVDAQFNEGKVVIVG